MIIEPLLIFGLRSMSSLILLLVYSLQFSFFFFQTTAVSELLAFCPLPTSSALSLGHSWGKECALHIILQQSSPAVISLESKYGSGANFFFSSPHQRIFNRLCVSSGKLPKHLWCYSFSFFLFFFYYTSSPRVGDPSPKSALQIWVWDT